MTALLTMWAILLRHHWSVIPLRPTGTHGSMALAQEQWRRYVPFFETFEQYWAMVRWIFRTGSAKESRPLMNRDPDHYKILGVATDSDDVVIQAAYKALMRKYHPDTSANPNAKARAQAINAAFTILGDPVRRAAYDASHTAQDSHGPTSTSKEPPPAPGDKQDGCGLKFRVTNKNAPWIATVGLLILVVVASQSHQSNTPISSESDAVPVGEDTFLTSLGNQSNAPGASSMPPPAPLLVTTQNRMALPLPPIPLDFTDLEAAADAFDKVLSKRGIVGARAFSESCHKNLRANPTWSAADTCTAFDLGATHVDAGMTKVSEGAVKIDKYFNFMDENSSDTYTELGIYAPYAQERIANIRKSIGPIVDDAIVTRLNREQAARNASTGQSATDLAGHGPANQ